MSVFPGAPAGDLLVPPPFGGFQPWWERVPLLLRWCGQPLAWIFLLTFALPQLVQAWVVATALEGLEVAGNGLILPAPDPATADQTTAQFTIPTGGLLLWLVLAYVAVAGVAAIGWGAGIWVVTQAAAGQPVTLGAAFGAAARRVVPMFGWYVLYSLMVAVGALLCLAPGIYLAIAGGLFSFVVMYERGRNPMGRSFSLVHKSFWLVLGRFALVFVFMLFVFCVVGLIIGLVGLGGADASQTAQLAADAVLALALVPVYPAVLVAMLLTYTQARAREETTLDTAGLWAAANEDLAGGGPVDRPGPFASG